MYRCKLDANATTQRRFYITTTTLTAILLMLSLVALLLVGAAVADNDIIRLPEVTTEGTKPCCKTPVCTKRKLCYCADLFEDKGCGGAGTCRNCKSVKFQGSDDPVLYICRDAALGGGPLPDCKDAGN